MFKSLDSIASVVGICMYLTISKFKQVLRSRKGLGKVSTTTLVVIGSCRCWTLIFQVGSVFGTSFIKEFVDLWIVFVKPVLMTPSFWTGNFKCCVVYHVCEWCPFLLNVARVCLKKGNFTHQFFCDLMMHDVWYLQPIHVHALHSLLTLRPSRTLYPNVNFRGDSRSSNLPHTWIL